MEIQYIHTNSGEQSTIIILVDFRNDLFQRLDLRKQIIQNKDFGKNYYSLLEELSLVTKRQIKEEQFYSHCGAWNSDKSGDEINADLYSSRMDTPREVIL